MVKVLLLHHQILLKLDNLLPHQDYELDWERDLHSRQKLATGRSHNHREGNPQKILEVDELWS